MKIYTFRQLRIWQEAHALTLEIYRVTANFPAQERYSLTAQLQRSSSSVATNIAEGTGRNSTKEFINFLNIARGSAKEALYQCILAAELGYIEKKISEGLVRRYEGLGAGIHALMEKLKRGAEVR